MNETQSDREKVKSHLAGWTGLQTPRERPAEDLETPRDRRCRQTAARLRHPNPSRTLPTRKLPRSWKPPGPPARPAVACPLTPRAEEAGRPHRNLAVWGERGRAGGRGEWRGAASGQAAGSGYTKAPVSAPPAPGPDINNMYIHLYIYTGRPGRAAGAACSPEGPGVADSAPSGVGGSDPHRQWPGLSDSC